MQQSYKVHVQDRTGSHSEPLPRGVFKFLPHRSFVDGLGIHGLESRMQAQALDWLQTSDCPAYLAKAEASFAEESQHVATFLDPTTEPKIIEVLEEELILNQVDRVLSLKPRPSRHVFLFLTVVGPSSTLICLRTALRCVTNCGLVQNGLVACGALGIVYLHLLAKSLCHTLLAIPQPAFLRDLVSPQLEAPCPNWSLA